MKYLYKHIIFKPFLLAVLLMVSIAGCKDDDPPKAENKFEFDVISLAHIDEKDFMSDTIVYKNASDNEYSVTRLQYYLSDFSFHHVTQGWFKSEDILYVDYLKAKQNLLTLKNFPEGQYDSIAFGFGLNAGNNVSGSLRNTIDNFNMAWPEPMGGGYHFLKLEGRFINDKGGQSGYAMHIGTNVCYRKISLPFETEMSSEKQRLEVALNLNEWYKNPHLIDFDKQSYTMGIDSAMRNLSDNSRTVFSVRKL